MVFKNIMSVGDQKLLTDLEWPNDNDNNDDTTNYFTPKRAWIQPQAPFLSRLPNSTALDNLTPRKLQANRWSY